MNETGDFDFYPAEHSISFSSTDGEKVEIEWSDGHQSKFNFLWLRDNCPCCVHPDTMEPLFNVASIADDEFISSVSTSEEGFLQVVWSKDSHISHFHPGWLRANCFLDASNRFTPKAIAWDSKTRKELHLF